MTLLTAAPVSSSLAQEVAGTVMSGSLLLAIPIALAAGLVSFLSPCVLPLVPGYLSYVTGLSGADLSAPHRGRVLAGTVLFMAGFTAVFASFGALFGGLGALLLTHATVLTRILGVVVIAMGLAFLGWIPGLQREKRLHLAPSGGIAGAPLLGAAFGLGWTPCIGPALAAVQTLAFTQASAGRGALLSVAYGLGLGVPFLAVGLAFRRTAGALGWVRRHRLAVMRTGGAMLVLTGLLLVTGLWDHLMITLRVWTAAFQPVI
jgi:cytochrome c-type biogenesis protein